MSLIRRPILVIAMFFATAITATVFAQSINVEGPGDGETFNVGDPFSMYWSPDDPDLILEYGNSIQVEYELNESGEWAQFDCCYKPFENKIEYTIPEDWAGSNVRLRVIEYFDGRGEYSHKPGETGLFFVEGGCKPITIFNQLEGGTYCTDDYLFLYIDSDARNGIYQWYRNGRLFTETTENYLFWPITSAADAGEYFGKVLIECGESAQTNPVRIDVAVRVSITAQPEPAVDVCEGGLIRLDVSAEGNITGYQWRFNGEPIEGATERSITIDNINLDASGQYDVVVYGFCKPEVYSEPTSVSVSPILRIVTEPVAQSVCPGSEARLSIETRGIDEVVYQWYRNGDAVQGANGAELVLSNVDESVEGAYQVVVSVHPDAKTQCREPLYSQSVLVSVFDTPTIVAEPTNIDACVGGTTSISVAAQGSGLSYRWFKNGQPISGGFASVNGPALEFTNTTPDMAGTYTVVVTGSCGLSVSSQPVTVTTISKPLITREATNASVEVGARVELSVDGTDIRSVYWMKNGNVLPNSNTLTYVIPSATTADVGIYNAVLVNSCGKTITRNTRVRVEDASVRVPELTLAQTTADFGDIPVGYSGDVTLTNVIKNTGNADMNVQSITIDNSDFTIVSGNAPFTLAPGASSTLVLRASASSIGERSATLTVNTNAPIPSEELTLLANSVLRYTAWTGLDFETVEVGTTKELCITLTNTSNVPVTLDALSITGTDASAFTIVTSAPQSLAVGASVDVCMTFAPGTMVGPRSATLAITSTTGGNSTVALTGIGDNTSSVDELTSDMVRVYPNPTTDRVVIETSAMNVVGVDIIDATGRLVARPMVNAQRIEWNTIDTTGVSVAAGMYTVVIRTTSSAVSVPLSIVR